MSYFRIRCRRIYIIEEFSNLFDFLKECYAVFLIDNYSQAEKFHQFLYQINFIHIYSTGRMSHGERMKNIGQFTSICPSKLVTTTVSTRWFFSRRELFLYTFLLLRNQRKLIRRNLIQFFSLKITTKL
jgi:hypothetical protein